MKKVNFSIDYPKGTDVSVSVDVRANEYVKTDNEHTAEIGNDYDGVVQDFTAGVEQITSLHRQTMYGLVKGKQFAWYETQVKFNEQLTQNNLDDVHITDVTNVFQTFEPEPLCQTITSNVVKGMLIPAPVPDVWIEDFDLSKSEVSMTVDDVLALLKKWNGVISPSNGITLRKPVGPIDCNAQYVIGNIQNVIFIDAVTGDITDWCPAFPKPASK